VQKQYQGKISLVTNSFNIQNFRYHIFSAQWWKALHKLFFCYSQPATLFFCTAHFFLVVLSVMSGFWMHRVRFDLWTFICWKYNIWHLLTVLPPLVQWHFGDWRVLHHDTHKACLTRNIFLLVCSVSSDLSLVMLMKWQQKHDVSYISAEINLDLPLCRTNAL